MIPSKDQLFRKNCESWILKKGPISLGLSILLLLGNPLFGQIVKLPDETSFSAEAVRFYFDVIPEPGAEVSDFFSAWGVTFQGVGPTGPRIRRWEGIDVVPSFFYTLVNYARGEDSINRPLIVNFKFPVKRVGFWLVAGDGGFIPQDSVTAKIKVFDALGNELGTIDQGFTSGAFIGMETTAPSGISKIVIDYGATRVTEEIRRFLLEFLERPKFNRYLPQIADGIIPGGVRFQTMISVSNLSNLTAEVKLMLFDDTGQPISLKLDDGSAASRFDLNLPGYTSKSLTTSGTSSPAVPGYTRIESNVPVEGVSILRAVDGNGNLITEAGVGSAEGKVSNTGVLQRVVNSGIDSGLAIVNVSTLATHVGIRLFSESVAAGGELFLKPGQHLARFLTELFPVLASVDFKGSLHITSGQPIAVIILRTAKALPTSSLPVGSTQK